MIFKSYLVLEVAPFDSTDFVRAEGDCFSSIPRKPTPKCLYMTKRSCLMTRESEKEKPKFKKPVHVSRIPQKRFSPEE